MKALILSFFAVILGYSLIFDEGKTVDQPVIKDSNSVYVDRPINMQISDSIVIYKDQTASVLWILVRVCCLPVFFSITFSHLYHALSWNIRSFWGEIYDLFGKKKVIARCMRVFLPKRRKPGCCNRFCSNSGSSRC